MSNFALTAGAVDGIKNLYEWSSDDGLRLASVPPSGEPPFGSPGTFAPNQYLEPVGAHAMSADGSRFVFGTLIGDRLFLRENGVTREIAPGGSSKRALTMTRDGRYVFLSSVAAMTPGAGTRSVYRYDTATGDLIDVAQVADPDPADGGYTDITKIYSISDDGRRVYFSSFSKLTADASPRTSQMYVSDNGQVKLIGALASSEYIGVAGFRMSDNGRYFLFRSYANLTRYSSHNAACVDLADGQPAGDCAEVFLYSADANTLNCLSCDERHGSSGHSSVTTDLANLASVALRWVLDDGEAFFETPNALLPQDTNGQVDVYGWKDHKLELISSGQSSTESTFANATADGDSVFFFTGERLVAQDIDRNVDLYVARRGGGLAAQRVDPRDTAPPCTGDACRPAPAERVRETSIDTDRAPGADEVAPDRAAFSVKALTASQRSALARGQKVSLAVSVNRAGTVNVSADAKLGKRSTAVAGGTAKATKAQTVHVGLRLSAAARRQLASKSTLRVAIVVRFTGASKARSLVVTVKSAKRSSDRSAAARRDHSIHTTPKGR